MIQYIIECIGFQLLFLIIYDVFLKKETFFQWNRVYLIGAFLASLVLPFIKIDVFKTTIASSFVEFPTYFQGILLDELVLKGENNATFILSLEHIILFSGMFVALLIFCYKLYQVHQLTNKGTVRYLTDFTRVIIQNSEIAFSFFKSVFIGDKIMAQNHQAIIAHELVHIRQGHSYDLIFFELMRVVAWFNPLVYVYQNRISEVHEFIADAAVAKTHKKEQYQLLLTQVFRTQHISFINPFFKSSLIKKRIVMLQKSKSRKALALKYALVVPAFLAILFYTSCESDSKIIDEEVGMETITEELSVLEVSDIKNPTSEEAIKINHFFNDLSGKGNFIIKDNKGGSIEYKISSSGDNTTYFKIKRNDEDKAGNFQEKNMDFNDAQLDIPFSVIENPPVFPGCEDADDKRACFQEKMFSHISKNFRYPEDAQENGIQGKVYINFIIGTDGSIQKVRTRGPNVSLEEEAERIVAKLPKMTPGLQRGKAVNVPFSIPITFKLE
ncbi:M56 family metallopeptidase [Cellulophaga sp. Hel_I_12]|uniref:M56 family metallopeptidase n=1 Tax=Cellulophaga sp. Hel_I_12 TaxID=1249972 RepID=UPI000649246D|nr:M56 family metallopeptidase [Cellulophaga sp. Hel_I_12]